VKPKDFKSFVSTIPPSKHGNESKNVRERCLRVKEGHILSLLESGIILLLYEAFLALHHLEVLLRDVPFRNTPDYRPARLEALYHAV
jgi:hypothetical protein